MEKTYKRVPFDIELAKKIQSGEVEGRIVTVDGETIRILALDIKDNCSIAVAITRPNGCEVVCTCHSTGKYIEGQSNSSYDLAIELYEETPKYNSFNKKLHDTDEVLATPKPEFKPFDKVLVRANNEMCWKPTFYVRTEITEDNKTFYETIGGVYHEQCITYEGNEHLVGTINNAK